MSQNLNSAVAVIGIDIGKNSFHVVGLDYRGAIVLRQKWSRGQIEARLANMPPCLIGMEACVGAHHLSRKLKAFGHDDKGRETIAAKLLTAGTDKPMGSSSRSRRKPCQSRGGRRQNEQQPHAQGSRRAEMHCQIQAD
jgi:hypothetical protein